MTSSSDAQANQNSSLRKIAGEWPVDGLETVPACPLCGSSAKSMLHSGLRDYAFKTAPGAWTLQQCGGCGCAFLDPRPNVASIGLAYESYYTHASGPAGSWFERLRRRIAHAYLNHRYGTSYSDALPGGQYLVALIPAARGYLDATEARHLGRPEGDAHLLDVGCGNGAFLRFASQQGWKAEGIDSDPAAVAAARATGCEVVLGELESLPPRGYQYQQITLSHVIEHVHDPLKLLRQCFDLLAPGGRLWLETPNLQSLGHTVFGSAWRGLEPPRHLVLFNRSVLTSALAATGFEGVAFRSHPGVSVYMWLTSRKIARESGRYAKTLGRKLLGQPAAVFLAETRAAYQPHGGEFLTCIAFRPAGQEEGST